MVLATLEVTQLSISQLANLLRHITESARRARWEGLPHYFLSYFSFESSSTQPSSFSVGSLCSFGQVLISVSEPISSLSNVLPLSPLLLKLVCAADCVIIFGSTSTFSTNFGTSCLTEIFFTGLVICDARGPSWAGRLCAKPNIWYFIALRFSTCKPSLTVQ